MSRADLALRIGEMPALCSPASAPAALQAQVDVGEPRVLVRFDIRLVLRDFARFLLARQVGGESRELLMAGLPECAQLEKHQRAETRFRIAEQIAERVHLFLHADGGAFLLLQPIAQQVKFVLEVRVGLFQARTILEQLHEPLFVGSRRAAVRTAF